MSDMEEYHAEDFRKLLYSSAKNIGIYKGIARELFREFMLELPESKRIEYRNILWREEMINEFKEE